LSGLALSFLCQDHDHSHVKIVRLDCDDRHSMVGD
jgi:hypothetical protein